MCQAQGNMIQQTRIRYRASSSSIQSDLSSASKRTSKSIQLVHRNTRRHTQVRPSRDKTILARQRRTPAIQTSLGPLATREETAWALSSRTRTSGNTDRSARRRLSTWEYQGLATTKSLATSISETQLDPMTGRARTPSSASA